uniref:Transmembrane protein n=1 Tax=Macrostomum lignano TaxID=282301 RepID=A0A1I8FNZ1_9PLAT
QAEQGKENSTKGRHAQSIFKEACEFLGEGHAEVKHDGEQRLRAESGTRLRCTTSACHGWRFESNRPRLRLVSQQSDAIKTSLSSRSSNQHQTNVRNRRRQQQADGAPREQPWRQAAARIRQRYRRRGKEQPRTSQPRPALDNERSEQKVVPSRDFVEFAMHLLQTARFKFKLIAFFGVMGVRLDVAFIGI